MGVILVQIFRSGKLQDRIPQKLQPLVVGQVERPVLVQVRPVGKSGKIKVGVMDPDF
jgi:hypothetical protein